MSPQDESKDTTFIKIHIQIIWFEYYNIGRAAIDRHIEFYDTIMYMYKLCVTRDQDESHESIDPFRLHGLTKEHTPKKLPSLWVVWY